MPFTPFHFGPGFFVKSIFPKRFSFKIFILANIITDTEPLYFILTNQYPLHRFFHTYLGATFIAVVCIAFGRPICHWGTNTWNIVFKTFKMNNDRIPDTALVISAFIGTYSHVFLDSIMHRDITPFYPFNSSNGLLHSLSYAQLHLFCVLAVIAGGIIYVTKNLRKH